MKATLACVALLLAASARAAEIRLPAGAPVLSAPGAASLNGPAISAPAFPPLAEIPIGATSLSAGPSAPRDIGYVTEIPATRGLPAPQMSAPLPPLPASPELAAAQAGAMAAESSVNEGALRFDGAAIHHDDALLQAARETTSAEVRRILALKKRGVKVSKVLAAKDTKTITEYSGVPDRVRELPDDGAVYRHWVRNEEDLKSILASSQLRAGPVSYVEFTGSQAAFIKDIYPDLRGVFFTGQERPSSEPRVMNEATPHYVDFRLPRGVRALTLDGRDVMMIPVEPGTYVPVEIVGSSAYSK